MRSRIFNVKNLHSRAYFSGFLTIAITFELMDLC